MTTVRNPTAETKLVALPCQNGVAAGTGDNTELTSAAIDRVTAGGIGYLAGTCNIAYRTSLTAAATLKFTVKIAESDDGSSFGADTTLVNAQTVETGAQTNKDGTLRVDLELHKRKRYVRMKITADLSAGATDTFVYGAMVELFSPDRMPAA